MLDKNKEYFRYKKNQTPPFLSHNLMSLSKDQIIVIHIF